jgi:putative tryptophan/tyrosine transport system substrate-binding protein
MTHVQRREFITLLGGAAAAWPVAVRAQQPERMRRIGVLINGAEGDPYQKPRLAALWEGLAKLAWAEGRNLRIDLRYGAGDLSRIRAYAAELVSLAPEVIVTSTTVTTIAVQQQTKTIPIVFTSGGDPVVSGVVRNIARPEGNATGFSAVENAISGKWLELLKEAAPRLSRVALLFDTGLVSTISQGYISLLEAAAPTFALQTIEMPFRDGIDIVRAIGAFAAEPNGGLLVLPPAPQGANLETIIRLAAQHRLPTIYSLRDIATAGGLMSYGPDAVDRNRRAATYVDRLLRGAKVSELPVQFPTKFELVVNLKTAKSIGLTIPEAFLLRADELIE